MTKSFKDHYIEKSDKYNVDDYGTEAPEAPEIEEVTHIKPLNTKQKRISAVEENLKETSFSKEVLKTEIRSEVESKITEQVEARVRQQISEEYEQKFTEFKQQLSESLICEVVNNMNANNDLLLKVIETLAKKVEGLQESLNIEIPAPVVNVTMPDRKVERIVHRDSKGHITKITEQDGDE